MLIKKDGTFIIEINGMPYHCIQGDRYYDKILKKYKEKAEEFELEKKLEKNLEEEKEKKIRIAKGLCQDYIYSKYSLTDQLNIQNLILGYTEEDLNEMKDFIESEVVECRETVKKIEEAKDFEELDKIEVVKNG